MTFLVLILSFLMGGGSLALAAGARDQVLNAQLNAVEAQRVSTEAADQVNHVQAPPVQPANETIEPPLRPVGTNAPSHWVHDIFFSNRQPLNPRRVHTLEIGSGPYYYLYREPSAGVKNTGVMTQYTVNYTYRPPDGNILNNAIFNMYRLDNRFAFGTLSYKGSGTDRNDNYNYEVRVLLGKDYLMAGRSLLTPYLGFGYRYLLDKGDGIITSSGNYGYDRHSNYYYLPIGFTASIPYKAWTTDINLEYDVFINGLQVSDLSDGNRFGFNNPNIHNGQHSGYGIRGSFKLLYDTPTLGFYIEPYVRFWSIEQSHAVSAVVDGSLGNFVEPANTTLESGLELGLQF